MRRASSGFADIADGAWTIQIEMRGFATLTREVTIGPDAQPAMWELTLLPFEEITRGLPPPAPRPARAPGAEQPDGATRSQPNAPAATPQTGLSARGRDDAAGAALAPGRAAATR